MKMKYLSTAALALVLGQTVSAHYIWQTVNGGAKNAYVRLNTNYNSPITDTTSTDLRCNVGASKGGQTAVGTLAVTAGSKVTLGLDTAVYHQGPVMFYLGKVPSGSSADDWDGSGTSWFKFQQYGPTFSGGSSSWPMSITYDVTIPASLPNGEWLLRAEQIGIHNPAGLPQFYTGCAQIKVTGGGSCSPSYFAIPGHIKSTDPGLTVNIYSGFTSYSMPGPAVYTCTGSGVPGSGADTGSGSGGKSSTTKTKKGSKTSTAAPAPVQTTAAAPAGPAQSPYGQCGGSSWNGPTSCSSGTCKVLNSYYSQCQP